MTRSRGAALLCPRRALRPWACAPAWSRRSSTGVAVASLNVVRQARQRKARCEVFHLLPEGPDGTAVLLVPCQLLLELLQGGSDAHIVLNLQSQLDPCAAGTKGSPGPQDTPMCPSSWRLLARGMHGYPRDDSCLYHPWAGQVYKPIRIE